MEAEMVMMMKIPQATSSSSMFQYHIFPLCSSLKQTQQAHAAAVVHGLLPDSLTVCASLILTYASFHRRPYPPCPSSPSPPHTSFGLLFHHTPPHRRTAFLCNTLLRAHSVAGLPHRFSDAYNWMRRNGLPPDHRTFPCLLKACADFLHFPKGAEAHALLLRLGFHSLLHVANTLLLFYAACGRLRDAHRVFDEMPHPDAVSWNTLLGMLSLRGSFLQALSLFRDMIASSSSSPSSSSSSSSTSSSPNAVTAITVLPMCAELEDERTASQLHCYFLKLLGLHHHLTIGNALVAAYGKCGNMESCKRVFEEMAVRNVVSWNAIIACASSTPLGGDPPLRLLRRMMDAGVQPDAITLATVLPVVVVSESSGVWGVGKEIHAYAMRMGVGSENFVANSLIDMYAKSGDCVKATRVFYHMNTTKNVVSWNAMIANLAQNGLESDAVQLVRQMQMEGVVPNSITLTSLLPACARCGLLPRGKEIHAHSIRAGFAFQLYVSNALADMYIKCNRIALAQRVFHHTCLKDEVSYNTLITGYSQTGDCLNSLNLFSEMGLVGLKQDAVSFMGALSACANSSAIKQGKEIHGFAVRRGLHSHLFVANSLLDLYTKSGEMDTARKVFKRMHERDVASWNMMILAYGMLGEFETAIDLFEAMRSDGVERDSVSYIAALSACSHGGLVGKGRRYFEEMMDDRNTSLSSSMEPMHMHYACMVDLLGRAGFLEEAAELIRGLPVLPDANVWGALLGACRLYGNIELAGWAAEQLFQMTKPEEHPGYYTLLANMYAEAGEWDEAEKVRNVMKLRGCHNNANKEKKKKKSPGCSWVQVHGQVHAFAVGGSVGELDSPSVCWFADSD